MKFKFVKKGKEISSGEINDLMNFEQLVDKAAGIGSAPLAKGALASKSALLSKSMWLLTVPFTAVVYLAVEEFVLEKPMDIPEVPVEKVLTVDAEPAVIDSVAEQAEPEIEKAAAVPVKPKPVEKKKEAELVSETPATEEESDAESILIKEDIMIKAEPIDGFPAFYETIDKELTYPESARISNVEGFVQVYFVVDKDGKAGNFRVVRSLGDHFDEEALRVMRKLTEWKPATHNGQPVSQHLSIKLRFELEKE